MSESDELTQDWRKLAWESIADASQPWTWRQMLSSEALSDYPPRFSVLNRTIRDTMAVFYSDPWASLAVREVAKRAGRAPVSPIHRAIRSLAEAGLLVAGRSSGTEAWPRYRADTRSPFLLKLFEALEVERRLAFFNHVPALRRTMERVVNQLLESTSWEVLGVYVFGSWVRGQQQPESDLDILLVFPFADRVERDNIRAAERLLAGSWRPSIITTDARKLQEGFAKRGPFYQELWRDRVVVYGESVFWQILGKAIRE